MTKRIEPPEGDYGYMPLPRPRVCGCTCRQCNAFIHSAQDCHHPLAGPDAREASAA